jgi:hypothetical protein
VRDEELRLVQRLRGKHRSLNDACFFQLLFAEFFDGEAIRKRRGGDHSSLSGGERHGAGREEWRWIKVSSGPARRRGNPGVLLLNAP